MRRRIVRANYDTAATSMRARATLARDTSLAVLGRGPAALYQDEMISQLSSPCAPSLHRLWGEAGGEPRVLSVCVVAARWLADEAPGLANLLDVPTDRLRLYASCVPAAVVVDDLASACEVASVVITWNTADALRRFDAGDATAEGLLLELYRAAEALCSYTGVGVPDERLRAIHLATTTPRGV